MTTTTTIHSQKREISLGQRIFLPYRATAIILPPQFQQDRRHDFSPSGASPSSGYNHATRNQNSSEISSRNHQGRNKHHQQKNYNENTTGGIHGANFLFFHERELKVFVKSVASSGSEHSHATGMESSTTAASAMERSEGESREKEEEAQESPSASRTSSRKAQHHQSFPKTDPHSPTTEKPPSFLFPYTTLSYSCYGTISCVSIFHEYILVVLMEGAMLFLRLEDMLASNRSQSQQSDTPSESSLHRGEDSITYSTMLQLHKAHQMRVPCNVYCMEALEDSNKIVILSNDRRVYVYAVRDDSKAEHLTNTSPSTTSSPHLDITAFHCIKSWFVNRHMNSISRSFHLERGFSTSNDASNVLLIGFVSGEYAILELDKQEGSTETETQLRRTKPSQLIQASPSLIINSSTTQYNSNDELRIYETLTSSPQEGIQMPLFIKGDVRWRNSSREGTASDSFSPSTDTESPHIYLTVFASLDGHIIVDDPIHVKQQQSVGNHNPSQWHINLQTEIVGVTPIDITNDGYHEIMVVTWDGMTYFIDQNQNIVSFNLKQRVCGYAIGRFPETDDSGSNICIFFLTFDEKIIVCNNVSVDSIPMATFEQYCDYEAKDLLSYFAAPDSTGTTKLQPQCPQNLIEEILYGSGNIPDDLLTFYISQLDEERTTLRTQLEEYKQKENEQMANNDPSIDDIAT